MDHDPETGEVQREQLPAPQMYDHAIAPPTTHSLAPPLPTTPFDKLAGAIASVMEEIGVVPKHGENKFHNYKFSRIEDVLQALTPLTAKHGIVIMQSEIERGFMDKNNAIYATYDFTVMHKSGQVWPERQRQTGVSRTRDSKGGFDDKSLNKCHTQARKVFLMSLFQIPTGDEQEGRQKKHERPKLAEPDRQQPTSLRTDDGIDESKMEAWGRDFLAMINAASDIDGMEAFVKKSDPALNKIREGKPDYHKTLLKRVQARRLELLPNEEGS
jgi:hypothetical protein